LAGNTIEIGTIVAMDIQGLITIVPKK
jgi:hypothetical protein